MGGSNTTRPSLQSAVPTLRGLLGSSAATLGNLLAVTSGISGAVFLVSFVIARSEGLGEAYLGAASMHIVFLGVLGGPIVVLWGAKYHLQVWARVRACFAVSDSTYRDVVDPVLTRTYSVKRLVAEFLVALGLVVVWNLVLRNPIPYAIWFDGYEPTDHLLFSAGIGVDALSAINYLYGLAGLFTVVAGTHGVAYFLLLTRRVTDLPLQNAEIASERLEPIARFSIFVSTTAFVAAVLLLAVYARLLTMADGTAMDLAAFVTRYAFFILVVLTGLIIVGLLVFWLPQMAIHDALTEAKHERLVALEEEYDVLLEKCRAEAESPDYLATELDIVEAKRRNAMELDTWSYNLPSLVPFLGSGLATTVTWLLSVTGELSQLLG